MLSVVPQGVAPSEDFILRQMFALLQRQGPRGSMASTGQQAGQSGATETTSSIMVSKITSNTSQTSNSAATRPSMTSGTDGELTSTEKGIIIGVLVPLAVLAGLLIALFCIKRRQGTTSRDPKESTDSDPASSESIPIVNSLGEAFADAASPRRNTIYVPVSPLQHNIPYSPYTPPLTYRDMAMNLCPSYIASGRLPTYNESQESLRLTNHISPVSPSAAGPMSTLSEENEERRDDLSSRLTSSPQPIHEITPDKNNKKMVSNPQTTERRQSTVLLQPRPIHPHIYRNAVLSAEESAELSRRRPAPAPSLPSQLSPARAVVSGGDDDRNVFPASEADPEMASLVVPAYRATSVEPAELA